VDKLRIATITLLVVAWALITHLSTNQPAPLPETHIEEYNNLCPYGETPLITLRTYSEILTGKINLTPEQTIQVLNCCIGLTGNIKC